MKMKFRKATKDDIAIIVEMISDDELVKNKRKLPNTITTRIS